MYKIRSFSYGTAIVLVILFLAGCAKQGARPAHPIYKQQEKTSETKELTQKQQNESSAAMKLVERGKNQYNEGFFQDSMQTFEKAINIEPNNGEAYFWMAKSNFAIGDYDNAGQLLDQAKNYLSGSEWDPKIKKLDKEINYRKDQAKDMLDDADKYY